MADSTRWWEAKRAQSTKPATYRCPLCGGQLPAMSEHMLLFPEGDHNRRRHAHATCVIAARRSGKLPTRGEWQAGQPGQRSWFSRRRRSGHPGQDHGRQSPRDSSE